MKKIRGIDTVLPSRPTLEGAGVHLKRAFGPSEVPLLDPFLMLDDFHSENPADYVAGFPWHPHRGIETVTYMIRGIVEHGDTLGNRGSIMSGDVQWMTAGRGILHQEMPVAFRGMMQGFQLWVNLPASSKMMEPRYRDVRSDTIPSVSPAKGVTARVISGELKGTKGPVQDLVVEAEYLDVTMEPNSKFKHSIPKSNRVFAYVFEGSGAFDQHQKSAISPEMLVVFGDGEDVSAKAGESGFRFLLVSGKPLGEPVAWGGPIVMNTQAELDTAFKELRDGTFIKQ